MSDNTTLNGGTGGDVIRTDDIAGVKWACDKVAFGADGAATLVDDTHPLPAKSLSTSTGDYYPNMPDAGALDAGDLSAPRVNTDGMLEGRFSALSDEGSHYYPFSGVALPANFLSATGTGQSITVADSQVVIAAGSTANAEAYWAFLVDYMPLHGELKISISQRVANQDIYFELANGATPAADTEFARLHWQGTDNTKIRCETQSSVDTNGQEGIGEDFSESSSAVLTLHHIELTPEGCMFSYADETNLVQRKEEIPGIYTPLYARVRVKNGATPPTGNTLITVSFIKVANVNLTAVGAAFESETTPVIIKNVADVNVTALPTDPMGTNADVASATGTISAKLRYLAGTGLAGMTALPAGSANIGDVDVLTVPADPFGTNADALVAAGAAGSIQAKLRRITQGLEDLKTLVVLAAGDNNIGNVDVLTLPADPLGANADAIATAGSTGSISAKLRRATQGLEDLKTLIVLAAGSNAIGKLAANSGVDIGDVTINNTTSEPVTTGGNVAHDEVDSGNPVKIGMFAEGNLSTATMVADGDRCNAMGDLDGVMYMRPYSLGDVLSERLTNTDGNSTGSTVFGQTASARNCIDSIVVFNSSATAGYVDFRDGTAGSVLFTVPLPAGGGAVLPKGPSPYFRTSANTALAYDVSAALTTVYISLSGFKSKV